MDDPADITAEVVMDTIKDVVVPAQPPMGSPDLGASKPVRHFTPSVTVKHARVSACGHKFEAGHLPRKSNCEDCWFALFETDPEVAQYAHRIILADGAKSVTARLGAKFTKRFGKYMQKKLEDLHLQS